MEDITEETAELVAGVPALDIGEAELTACVRVRHGISRARAWLFPPAVVSERLRPLQMHILRNGLTCG